MLVFKVNIILIFLFEIINNYVIYIWLYVVWFNSKLLFHNPNNNKNNYYYLYNNNKVLIFNNININLISYHYCIIFTYIIYLITI